jgi:hypothetical protein
MAWTATMLMTVSVADSENTRRVTIGLSLLRWLLQR